MIRFLIYALGFSVLFSACASDQTRTQTPAAPVCSTCQASVSTVVASAAPEQPAAAVKPEPVKKEEETVKVQIETTMGVIEAELFAKEAPKTVENFVKLTEKGFYNGIVFHRVIPDFMIQTGDPTGTGMGGPGYQFEDEFSQKLKHDKAGILSMANAGPNTNGSQFFITVAATPWLDNRHAIFGHVTKGLEVAEQISMADRDRRDKPVKEIKMTKVSIIR